MRMEQRYARAAAAPDSAVLVVRARGADQVPVLMTILTSSGGHDPRVEDD